MWVSQCVAHTAQMVALVCGACPFKKICDGFHGARPHCSDPVSAARCKRRGCARSVSVLGLQAALFER